MVETLSTSTETTMRQLYGESLSPEAAALVREIADLGSMMRRRGQDEREAFADGDEALENNKGQAHG